jgi:protein-disulfide isomerase
MDCKNNLLLGAALAGGVLVGALAATGVMTYLQMKRDTEIANAPHIICRQDDEVCKTRFKKMVFDYLVNEDPSIIAQGLRANRAKNEAKAADYADRLSIDHPELFKPDELDGVAGNPGGDIVLIEYFDYACPGCKEMQPAVDDLIKTSPRVQVIYREFPFLTEGSETASRLALSARRLGYYIPFHDKVMALHISERDFTAERVFKEVKKLGFDVRKLKAGMNDPAIAAKFGADRKSAKLMGVHGTPSLFINGQPYDGGAEGLSEAVDRAIQKIDQKKPN